MIFFADGGPPNWVQSERVVERGPTDISLAPHYSWQTVGTEVFGSSLYQG